MHHLNLRLSVLACSLILLVGFSGISRPAFSQPKKGVLVAKQLCRADTNYSYAYYLPSEYDHMKRWPVIFVFEPGARGPMGVEVFVEMAEREGYAIFCSNNARNGPTKLIFEAAEAMFADVYSRFSLLNDRTYMSGFSGGSRVSSLVAEITGKVNAIIGIGAGLSESIKDPAFNYDYYGIVGNLDYNYSEMMLLERKLDSLGILHAFSVYDGPHQWAPPLQIELAVLWVEIQDMKQGIMEKDPSVVDRYVSIQDSLQQWFAGQDRPRDQVRTLKNWKNGVSGIGDTSRPAALLADLLKQKEVQSALAAHEMLIDREVAMRLEIKGGLDGIIYPYLYPERPEAWWEGWLEKINRYKADNDLEMQQLGSRLFATITANCWIDFYIYFEAGNVEKAGKFLDVWKIFEPESIAVHWYLAKYFTETGDRKKAVKQLHLSHEMGLKNYTRLLADTTFSKLIGYKRFDELIAEMDTIN